MNKNERAKQWRKDNPEKIKQHQKKYRDAHYPQMLQRIKNWRNKNPEKAMLQRVRARARRKGYEFNLELSDILIPKVCPIIAIDINKEVTGAPRDDSPSLDRIDNTKGYVKGNVMVISHKANGMKHNATPEELIKFARWVLITYGGNYDN
jgi:hypothetical protein